MGEPALQPYTSAQPPGERPRIPDSTPVYTPLIWVLAVLPLVGILPNLLYRPEYRFHMVGGIRTVDPLSIFTPAYLAVLALGFALYALQVVLCWLDRRELQRRGVVRPFHWAWSFLAGIVYVIGRSVIVHRVARPRGLVPIWVIIATTVVNLVVVIVSTVAMTLSMMQQMRPY